MLTKVYKNLPNFCGIIRRGLLHKIATIVMIPKTAYYVQPLMTSCCEPNYSRDRQP